VSTVTGAAVTIEDWGEQVRHYVNVPAPTESIPLAAVALVGRSTNTTIAVSPVAGSRKAAALMRHLFLDNVVDPTWQALAFERVVDMTSTVPMITLELPTGPPWPDDLIEVLTTAIGR
jgi:hypothetical protein